MAAQVLMRRHMISNQRGVVLIVGLVMVLLISIIALAAIRGSGLQEAIAGNMRGRNISFQATDSGISYAEQRIRDLPSGIPMPCENEINSFGILCWTNLEYTGLVNSGGSVMYFNDAAFADHANVFSLGIPDIASQPQVVVEVLTPYKPIDSGGAMESDATYNERLPYRISVRGVGITGDSSAIIQSTYNTMNY